MQCRLAPTHAPLCSCRPQEWPQQELSRPSVLSSPTCGQCPLGRQIWPHCDPSPVDPAFSDPIGPSTKEGIVFVVKYRDFRKSTMRCGPNIWEDGWLRLDPHLPLLSEMRYCVLSLVSAEPSLTLLSGRACLLPAGSQPCQEYLHFSVMNCIEV